MQLKMNDITRITHQRYQDLLFLESKRKNPKYCPSLTSTTPKLTIVKKKRISNSSHVIFDVCMTQCGISFSIWNSSQQQGSSVYLIIILQLRGDEDGM
jgi:outer membrane receptor for monomeric catechols